MDNLFVRITSIQPRQTGDTQRVKLQICLFEDFFTLDHGKETYLEDLYIREDYRRQGIGSVLLSSVWDGAKSRDSNGLYWVCLGWNTKSLDFYHSLGAKNQDVTFFRFEIDHEF